MPPKQDTLDQFLQLAPGFMNTMANTMTTMQAATTQMQADLDANAQQVNAALVNLDTASLTQTVARLGLPPARPYNPRQPHKWVSPVDGKHLSFTALFRPFSKCICHNCHTRPLPQVKQYKKS